MRRRTRSGGYSFSKKLARLRALARRLGTLEQAIVSLLTDTGPMQMADIKIILDVPNVRHALYKLRDCGLIRGWRMGKEIVYARSIKSYEDCNVIGPTSNEDIRSIDSGIPGEDYRKFVTLLRSKPEDLLTYVNDPLRLAALGRFGFIGKILSEKPDEVPLAPLDLVMILK